MIVNNVLTNFFEGENSEIPVWFLRQAGRHIPEYFKIREQANNFMEFCLNPKLIIESTKLPLNYYDLDAAIIFSDILMIPWAMNRKVNFIKGLGPQLLPMIPDETKILKNVDIPKKLQPLKDSISILKKELPQSKSLIGFAGAPWTLACYMIEGQSSKDFINVRKALWNSNKWLMELLETLSIYVADKLEMQANAGADVLMLFDSWSHMIPNNFFHECAIDPTARIINILKSKNISKPIIGFPFKAGTSLINYSYESYVDCIALDWTVDLNWAIKNLNSSIAIQGNLDPASLIPSESNYLEKNVLSILDIMKDNKFIFSVGHGLTPDCKIKNVKKVIDIVRNYK
jgi:uroporphyrinogen decarboxylase